MVGEMVPKQGRITDYRVRPIDALVSSQQLHLLAKSNSIGHRLRHSFVGDHYIHVSVVTGSPFLLVADLSHCHWTLQIVQLRHGYLRWSSSG